MSDGQQGAASRLGKSLDVHRSHPLGYCAAAFDRTGPEEKRRALPPGRRGGAQRDGHDQTTLGQQLVTMLTDQLAGELEVHRRGLSLTGQGQLN